MLGTQLRLVSMNLSVCLQISLETAFSAHFMFKHYTVKGQQLNLFARKYNNKLC